MKILVFGNPMVEKDSLALKLIPKLKKYFSGKFDFVEFDSTEDLQKQGRNLLILDVVEGLEKVEIIDDLSKLSKEKVYSMHDFDLSHNLRMLKHIGLLDSVKIIGLPMQMNEEKAFLEICKLLKNEF